MPEGAKLPEHPVRLVFVTATAITSRTRSTRESDPAEMAWSADEPRLASFSRDGQRFSCAFRTNLWLPLTDGQTWEVHVRLVGEFASSEVLKRSQGSFFAATSALFVMLPFARAYLMELGHIAGVGAPPLPLVVRPPESTLAARP